MTTLSHPLGHDLAMRIVTKWRERVASKFSLSICIDCRPHEFAPTWNTLSIKHAVAPLLEVREAIEIWHAENALRIQFESSRPAIPVATTESFPAVLLHSHPMLSFYPYLANSNYGWTDENECAWDLGFLLGAFFGMLGSNSTTRSLDHQASMHEIRPFAQSGRVQTVPIRVKLRLAVEKGTHKKLLQWLDSDYQAIYAHLQSSQQRSHLEPKEMLLGFQLVVNAPPHTLHFKWLHQLLERMPESIPVEFVSHSLAPDQVMVQRDMLPLLENVMGKLGGPTGRLELLNLSSGVELTKLGLVDSALAINR